MSMKIVKECSDSSRDFLRQMVAFTNDFIDNNNIGQDDIIKASVGFCATIIKSQKPPDKDDRILLESVISLARNLQLETRFLEEDNKLTAYISLNRYPVGNN